MRTAAVMILAFGLCTGLAAQEQPMSPSAKKLNSISCAKVLAERNIVETVYGVKLRFTEEVNNILEGSFQGSVETKTGRRTIKGIEFEPVKYDAAKDIAQATAILKLSNIADIVDKEKFNIDKFPDKVIKRTAFATSTPDKARKIAAIRAAEIDAYKNLYKKIGGFTLESNTKIENFVLKSENVKASVIGALMGADFMGFSWEGEGDDAIVTVKLRINAKELSEMLGEKIVDMDKEFIEAEGQGMQKAVAIPQKRNEEGKQAVKTDVIEGNINIMP
ncbi:MAG TPA: hypothetical protein DET40_23545 [Lentisphaeria bacterium]|nr:MAG: hypothetical protein A2X45_23760 [Lentisphaerae bacterium GWF2_50_93]HCE46531.1 hypothetical protein [Lentisphaeria bacterium]